MVEWKTQELGEVCDRLSSGKGIAAKNIHKTGIYPVYGGNGKRGYTDNSNFQGDCVIIGRQGAFCGNVHYFSGEAYMTEHAVVVQANNNNNTRFLAYYLSTMNLGRLSGQSAQPGLSVKTLAKLEVTLPVFDVQEKIADILAVLDKKIENNQQINNNLEQQAQAIFKSWFVDSTNFPSTWKVVKLGDIAQIKTKSFSPAKYMDVMLEHYSIPALDEKRYPVFEIATNIKSNKYILTKNSVMISKLNPKTKRIWRPSCLSAHPVCSTEFIVYEALNPMFKDFIYSIIDSDAFSEFLCAHTTGSTNSRQRATPSTTLEYSIILPPNSVIQEFCNLVTPLYEMVAKNIIQNQTLIAIRDNLLPKLMSGELDVIQHLSR